MVAIESGETCYGRGAGLAEGQAAVVEEELPCGVLALALAEVVVEDPPQWLELAMGPWVGLGTLCRHNFDNFEHNSSYLSIIEHNSNINFCEYNDTINVQNS